MHVAFAIPGDLALPTGGYGYDRRLLRHLPAQGIAVEHVELPDGFPAPDAEDLAETGRRLLSLPPDRMLLIDGLAYGAFPTGLAAGLAGRVVALCHHPLALETGTPPARAAELRRLEAAALGYAAGVIVTGGATAEVLARDYGVDPARITVAEPGVDRAPRALPDRPPGAPVQLLAVGSLVPRKGYDVLVSALAAIAGLPWHLTIAGAADRAPAHAAELRERIARAGLERRVTLHGGLPDEDIEALYAGSDLFVLSSHYEGFGMVLTEALARGLPIVTTRGGAGADALPDSAAQKVAPGDAAELAGALAYLIGDASARARHADAAWAAASGLPGWDRTAALVADALRRAADPRQT